MQPPPLDWAVITAFYAAVHYVNAYLWETQRYEPRDHAARQRAVEIGRGLRAAARSYRQLRDLGYRSRYSPTFQPTPPVAQDALRIDLALVETTVLAALGVSP